MFLKSYKLKSQTPLGSSQKRQFRQRLEKCFPNATNDEINSLIAPKSNVSQIKILTASQMNTNIFCIDKLPMFFEVDDQHQLAPTLYALWVVPTLLPYFKTLPDVLPRLSNGADLMLPGVIPNGTGMNKYGRFPKGQLVAVNLTTNKAAVGVGLLTRSTDDLFMCGGQGSAVKMLHLFGDKLWGHEPALIQQIPSKPPKAPTTEDFPPLGAAEPKKSNEKANLIQNTTSNVEVVNVVEEKSKTEEITLEELNVTDKEEIEPCAETETEKGTETTNAAETVLKNAFLSAIKNNGKTLQLPLLTSNFFRLYVMPEAEQPIDIKKTKFKKLSNFLNEMASEGFIVVREESKGVDKITSLNLAHDEVVNFITDYKPPAPTENEGGSQQLFHSELTELYIVTEKTAAFFTRMNFKRGEGIPVAQVKKIIREYVSKNELTTNQLTKCIRLDETLQKLCDCQEATLSQICSLIIKQMEHSYQMCSVKDVASNKPLIQMSLATRSGNKKVTLISNLECYGIVLPEFIKICKQGAAASTSVVQLPNQKREQLQVQGNQVRFLFNLLTETYKIPAKNILGIELAKDGKKHKKK